MIIDNYRFYLCIYVYFLCFVDKAGCTRINPNMTVFINGISSSGKSQAMIFGVDKLDGVSKMIENDHMKIKNFFISKYNKHLRQDAAEPDNDVNINDENDVNINDENVDDGMDDEDVLMRDMTPFVSVAEAKSTKDSRVDISYNRRTFTDVCNLLFFENLL